jgi:hypothetical protein
MSSPPESVKVEPFHTPLLSSEKKTDIGAFKAGHEAGALPRYFTKIVKPVPGRSPIVPLGIANPCAN